MNIHEYQAKELFKNYNIPTQLGILATTVEEAEEAAKKIGSNIAHYDRHTFELDLFKEIISVPTLVIGIN